LRYFSACVLFIVALSAGMLASAQIPSDVHPVPYHHQDTMQQLIATRVADYEVSKDPRNDRVVYKGIFSYADMEKEPNFSWVTSDFNNYMPDPASVEYLSKHFAQYRLLIFAGTWCGDTKLLLPGLYKTLSALNIDYHNLMIVGMDRNKKTTTKQAKKLVKHYHISLLPTFVLLNEQGNEVGRIEESVNKSVEADLVEIMKGGGK
jgi:thiol-disulfide isomerase/thioredoxin